MLDGNLNCHIQYFIANSQPEIDHALSACFYAEVGSIHIASATQTVQTPNRPTAVPRLVFKNVTIAEKIMIRDSPNLEVLFPALKTWGALIQIDNSRQNASTRNSVLVSLPSFKSEEIGLAQKLQQGNQDSLPLDKQLGFHLSGGEASIWVETQLTSLGYVSLRDSRSGFTLQSATDREVSKQHITAIHTFTAYGCHLQESIFYPNLSTIGRLSLSTWDCILDLRYVTYVNDLELDGMRGVKLNSTQLKVRRTLTMRNSTAGRWWKPAYKINETLQVPIGLDMAILEDIEKDVNVTANFDTSIDLSGLRNIGGDFIVANNRNCSVNLRRLVEVEGDLTIADNPGTSFPAFPSLEKAGNIFIRGVIDT